MPSLSRNVVHDYDPKAEFHNQAINIPLLTTWIDELVNLTEKSLPVRNTPTTEQLVESLQRYDAVFRELMRQTGKYSGNITKMFGKVWTGTLNLLDYMIKSYHRYVTTTDHLQEQARQLLKQRAAQVAASDIQKEEFQLERTALRAQIRTLQAEVDAMGATQRGLQRENSTLREIIDNYIKSTELSESTWEILDEDGGVSRRNKVAAESEYLGMEEDEDEGGTRKASDVGRRKANVDASRKHLRNMNRLDIEMNEAVANVLKEEDRQRMLVSDLELLMAKNSERMKLYAEQLGQRVIQVPPPVMVEAGVQVDEKYSFGAVTELTEAQRQAEWEDASVSEAPDVDYEPFSANFVAIPFQIRSYMSVFPRVLRIPPLAWVMQLIFAIYMDKIDRDIEAGEMGKSLLCLGPHVYDYFLRLYGIKALADNQVAQFVAALNHHYDSHKRVELFCHQMGVVETNESPELDLRDTIFILDVLYRLKAKGELRPDPAPKGVTTSLVFRTAVTRASVVAIVPDLFGTWLEDGGQDIVLKFKSMPATTDKGPKFLDVDNVLDVLVDVWCGVRITWEDHLHYLFHDKASTFTVLSDSQFATDHGGFERDSVLVKVNKNSTTDCSRRPMRMIQKRDVVVAVGEEGAASAHRSHIRPMQVGNPSKEAVVDVLTRDDFFAVMEVINPYQDAEVVGMVYEEAVAWGYEAVLKVLEQTWVKMYDDDSEKHFYLNKKTGKTQWTCPYNPKTFRSGDIEEEAFMAILIQENVLAKSPFLDLVHLAPKDLWPNSDMFLKQKEARILKEKAKEKARLDAIEADRLAKIRADEEAKFAAAEAERLAREAAELEEEEKKKKSKKKKGKKGGGKAGRSKSISTSKAGMALPEDGSDSRPDTGMSMMSMLGGPLEGTSRPGTAEGGESSRPTSRGSVLMGDGVDEAEDGDDDDASPGGSRSTSPLVMGLSFGDALSEGTGFFSHEKIGVKVNYAEELKASSAKSTPKAGSP